MQPRLLLGVIATIAVIVISILVKVHLDLKEENRCGMTFMWRAIFFPPVYIPGTTENNQRYSLHRYSEGRPIDFNFLPSSNDVPVLFVPGSGGSGFQVRSIASISLNKTEMAMSAYKLHFYAVDFDEELSFLSGEVLYRQRDFVVRSINYLKKLYSKSKVSKLLVIGHSFGGVILRSLPAHPDFDVSSVDLIISMAAPHQQSPLITDRQMTKFYSEMNAAWQRRKDELKSVGIVSYSGGEKDFLVPDRLSDVPNVFHMPSWSIRGVGTSADHLCILWCNQLVRAKSRIVIDYVKSYFDSVPLDGKTLSERYFNISRNVPSFWNRGFHDLSAINVTFNFWSFLNGFSKEFVLKNSKQFVQFPAIGGLAYDLQIIALSDDCKAGLTVEARSSDGLFSFVNSVRYQSILILPRRMEGNITALIRGKSECSINFYVRPSFVKSFYLSMINNIHLIIEKTFRFVLFWSALGRWASYLYSVSGLFLSIGFGDYIAPAEYMVISVSIALLVCILFAVGELMKPICNRVPSRLCALASIPLLAVNPMLGAALSSCSLLSHSQSTSSMVSSILSFLFYGLIGLQGGQIIRITFGGSLINEIVKINSPSILISLTATVCILLGRRVTVYSPIFKLARIAAFLAVLWIFFAHSVLSMEVLSDLAFSVALLHHVLVSKSN